MADTMPSAPARRVYELSVVVSLVAVQIVWLTLFAFIVVRLAG